MKDKLNPDKNKFWSQWILANGVGWFAGFILAIILSYSVVNRFYQKETNLIVGLCVGGVVAYAQWLVLKRYIKISTLWIPAAAIGIGIPFMLAIILMELKGIDTILVNIEIIDQAIIITLGGLLTGLMQYNLFKYVSEKYKWWILISTLAWGICWFFSLFGGVVYALMTGFAILKLFDFPVEDKSAKSG